jgi:hypothetical protein
LCTTGQNYYPISNYYKLPVRAVIQDESTFSISSLVGISCSSSDMPVYF